MDTFTFDGKQVALVVRGKQSHDHAPGVMEQHADVVLADGSPMGFFGEQGEDGSVGSSGRSSLGRSSSGSGSSYGSSGNRGASFGSLGMGYHGIVYDYALLQRNRPYYVDLGLAQTHSVVSTLLIIDVTEAQAKAFTRYWQDLQAKPKTFNILGGNCSVRASEGFRQAGILGDGIPGLDTPDHLYGQIFKDLPTKVKSYSGHLGFVPKASGYDVVMDVTSRKP